MVYLGNLELYFRGMLWAVSWPYSAIELDPFPSPDPNLALRTRRDLFMQAQIFLEVDALLEIQYVSKQVTLEADSVVHADALHSDTLRPANSNGIVKPNHNIRDPGETLSWKYVD